MLFLALLTSTIAGTSNFGTSRRVVDIDDAEFSFENDSNEIEFAMKGGAVENIADLMDDAENMNNMTVDGVEDLSNKTEVLRRRMTWHECSVYKGSQSPKQFIYLHGQCHHIQSATTVLNWWGRNVYRTISQGTMNLCNKGKPIRWYGWLAKGETSHEVYAIYNGKKHHIANRDIWGRCKFDECKIMVLPQGYMDSMKRGRSIRA